MVSDKDITLPKRAGVKTEEKNCHSIASLQSIQVRTRQQLIWKFNFQAHFASLALLSKPRQRILRFSKLSQNEIRSAAPAKPCAE